MRLHGVSPGAKGCRRSWKEAAGTEMGAAAIQGRQSERQGAWGARWAGQGVVEGARALAAIGCGGVSRTVGVLESTVL